MQSAAAPSQRNGRSGQEVNSANGLVAIRKAPELEQLPGSAAAASGAAASGAAASGAGGSRAPASGAAQP